MTRIIIATAIATMLAGAAHAEKLDPTYRGNAHMIEFVAGCSYYEALKKLGAFQHEPNPVTAYFAHERANGNCPVLKAGTEVNIEDFSPPGDSFCVRPQGVVADCLYVPRESVGR